jgi:acetamidase/formamidase
MHFKRTETHAAWDRELAPIAVIAPGDEITARTGLAPVDAYLLASVAADLKISEVVDMPNWVVSAHLELAYL